MALSLCGGFESLWWSWVSDSLPVVVLSLSAGLDCPFTFSHRFISLWHQQSDSDNGDRSGSRRDLDRLFSPTLVQQPVVGAVSSSSSTTAAAVVIHTVKSLVSKQRNPRFSKRLRLNADSTVRSTETGPGSSSNCCFQQIKHGPVISTQQHPHVSLQMPTV